MSEPTEPSSSWRLPVAVTWCVFFTYLIASRLVGSFFPLSIFDMYSNHVEGSIGRIMVLDAAGDAHELSHFEAFHCPEGRPSLMEVRQS